jgi:hypothetical protein
MTSDDELKDAAGYASMLLIQIVFSVLVKRGILSSEEVQELVDGAILETEHMSGNACRDSFSRGIRENLSNLLKVFQEKPARQRT